MNFLSKLFNRPDAEEKKPAARTTISFPELESWLTDEASGFLEPISQTMGASFEKMDAVSMELESNLRILEGAKNEEEPEERLKGLAFDNRSALIKKLRAFKSKLEFPDAKSIPDASKFHGELGTGLNTLVRDTSKNIYFTNLLFPEEVKEINSTLRKLSIISSESQKILHENKEKTGLFFRAKEKIREIIGLVKSQKVESEKLAGAEAALKKLADEEKKMRRELSGLNESEELASLNRSTEQRKILSNECAFIEESVLQMFSPLGKALKKYERYSAGLDKNEAKMLGLYMDSPFRALLADSELKILKKILENTEMLVSHGRIDLKGKQKEKTLSQLALLKDGSEISRSVSEYEKIKKKTGELESQEQHMEISKKICSVNEALAALEKRIEEEKEKCIKLENGIENTKQNISRNIKELEPMLESVSGKEVSVEFMP